MLTYAIEYSTRFQFSNTPPFISFAFFLLMYLFMFSLKESVFYSWRNTVRARSPCQMLMSEASEKTTSTGFDPARAEPTRLVTGVLNQFGYDVYCWVSFASAQDDVICWNRTNGLQNFTLALSRLS